MSPMSPLFDSLACGVAMYESYKTNYIMIFLHECIYIYICAYDEIYYIYQCVCMCLYIYIQYVLYIS